LPKATGTGPSVVLLGFAGTFRRSELAALTRNDIRLEDKGLLIMLRRSKTDQQGQGRTIGIPYGSHPLTCPVRAVMRFLAGTEGRGTATLFGICDRTILRIVQRLARQAGLEADLGAHSLRLGHATAAAQGGASEAEIMRQTGHRTVRVVRRYIQHGTVWQHNSATKLGL
jgi:integrase